MIERTLRALAVLVMAAALVACGNPVRDDMVTYAEKMEDEFVPTENRILRAYGDVTGENYTTDDDLYLALVDEIIPDYRRFLNDLEEHRPATPEVRELHERLIDAHSKQFNAMTQVVAALEQYDMTLVTDANERLDEARREFRRLYDEVESLAREHGLEFED